MNLHQAAKAGNEQAVRRLLAAGADFEAYDEYGSLAIHLAAMQGHVGVLQLLVEANPSTATVGDSGGWTPLYYAICQVERPVPVEAALCLVRAAPTVQPTLGNLVQFGLVAAPLYADLVSRLALTQQEWQSIPAPCPHLVRALPAVMERSLAEAGWLVGRLGQIRRARLRTGALCIGRVMAGLEGAPSLPAELSQRILVAALAEAKLPACPIVDRPPPGHLPLPAALCELLKQVVEQAECCSRRSSLPPFLATKIAMLAGLVRCCVSPDAAGTVP